MSNLYDLIYRLHDEGAIDEDQTGDLCMALARSEREAATPPLDVERLARVMDILFERRWGTPSPPMTPGSTTFAGAYAKDIAAEYARLAQQDGTGE